MNGQKIVGKVQIFVYVTATCMPLSFYNAFLFKQNQVVTNVSDRAELLRRLDHAEAKVLIIIYVVHVCERDLYSNACVIILSVMHF